MNDGARGVGSISTPRRYSTRRTTALAFEGLAAPVHRLHDEERRGELRVSTGPPLASGSRRGLIVDRHTNGLGAPPAESALRHLSALFPSDLPSSIMARLDSCQSSDILRVVVLRNWRESRGEDRRRPAGTRPFSLQCRDLEDSPLLRRIELNAATPTARASTYSTPSRSRRPSATSSRAPFSTRIARARWRSLHAPDAPGIHDALARAGATIVSAPFDSRSAHLHVRGPTAPTDPSTTAAEPGVLVFGHRLPALPWSQSVTMAYKPGENHRGVRDALCQRSFR